MNLRTIMKLTITLLVINLFQSAFAASAPSLHNKDLSMERAILLHINQYRQQHGLSALKMNNTMSQEARKHSVDMATHRISFGHKYFNSRIDTIRKQIKGSSAGAENVAYNYKTAENVVYNWVRSPGHKQNIVGNYNLTGIGIAHDKQGKIYFTQIFLRTGNGQPASRAFFKYF